MLRHSSKKFLVCQGDGWYFKRMAEYSCDEKHKDLGYLFNQTPSDWEQKIFDIMDFAEEVHFISTFNVKNVSELDTVFAGIVR